MSIMPPDGWSVDVGTWGTDVDIDTAVSQSGFSSLMIDCEADVTIYSDWIPVVGVAQTSTDRLVYEFSTVMYSSDSTLNVITMELEVYEDDRTTLVDTKNLLASSGGVTVPNDSAWHYYGRMVAIVDSEDTSRWARLKIVSSPELGTSDGHVWIDRVTLKKTTNLGVLQRSLGTQTIPATTNTKLYFEGVADEITMIGSTGSAGPPIVGGTIQALESGVYVCTFNLIFVAVDADSYVHVYIDNVSDGSPVSYNVQTLVNNASAISPLYCTSSLPIAMNSGDTVGLSVYAGHACEVSGRLYAIRLYGT